MESFAKTQSQSDSSVCWIDVRQSLYTPAHCGPLCTWFSFIIRTRYVPCCAHVLLDDWPVPRKHEYGKLHWQRPNKMQNFLSRIPISAGILPTSTSWTSKSQNDDDVLIPSNYCSTLQQQLYLFWSIHEEYLIGFLCKNLHSSLCEHI